MYFDRNATQSAAKRQFSRWGGGSGGMDRRSSRTPRGFCHRLLTAGGETHVSAEVGQFSRWGRGARLTRRVREEYRVYFDRNATQSAAKRRGSGGMDRRSNAAWVLPQAVKPAPRPRRVPEPSPRGRGADRGFDRRWAVDCAGPGTPVFTPAQRPGGPRRQRPQPPGWLSSGIPLRGEMGRDRRGLQPPAASPTAAPRRRESRFCLVVRGRAGPRKTARNVL